MSNPRLTVLVVGATGSIGRLVVEEAVKKGYGVRALARDAGKARRLFPDVEVVAGDLTRPDTLTAAVGGDKPDEHRLVLLQGDRRHAGDSSDGVIARRQLAGVLVASLTSDGALRKSFELVATQGPAQPDPETEFVRLDADPPGALDAVYDLPNMPLQDEPNRVRHDLETVSRQSGKILNSPNTE